MKHFETERKNFSTLLPFVKHALALMLTDDDEYTWTTNRGEKVPKGREKDNLYLLSSTIMLAVGGKGGTKLNLND